MAKKKPTQTTVIANSSSNGLRLGTGCAHTTMSKKTKGTTKEKEFKRTVNQIAKAVKVAVLAKLGYKKGRSQQRLAIPQSPFDISTI